LRRRHLAGSAGIRRYVGSGRVPDTRKVTIPLEYLGRLIEVNPFLRGALAKILAGN